MENEKSARYLAMMKEIENYTEKDFVVPKGFIIPLRRSVLIKQVDNTSLKKTLSGIIISNVGAEDTSTPMAGIIYAVGPECPEYLKPGQRVICNQYANLEVFIYGETYIKMDDLDVYGILPEEAFVSVEKKTPKEVIREKNLEREVNYNKKKTILDANDKDNAEWLKKLKNKGIN